MYVEFTVSQTMEHFLGCHERAFAALGVPDKVMVDNLLCRAPHKRFYVVPAVMWSDGMT
jgi:hypothetical protein